ncbi:MAG: ORF6N domain-containing protein [Paludibacter sp.]|nr:ORF6N domain-containing protein [Paludibacter sp.]
MEQQLIESKILTIREQKVILDSDVAELYGVETKRFEFAKRTFHIQDYCGHILNDI